MLVDAATVREVPESVMITPGEDAHLHCHVDGNPLLKKHVTWRHKGFKESDMKKRTKASFKNGTAYLDIHNPTKDDNGPFLCVANNGIGNESSKEIYLIVKCK